MLWQSGETWASDGEGTRCFAEDLFASLGGEPPLPTDWPDGDARLDAFEQIGTAAALTRLSRHRQRLQDLAEDQVGVQAPVGVVLFSIPDPL